MPVGRRDVLSIMLVLAVLPLVANCAARPAATAPLIGVYGADHIQLTVGTTDSAVEYDCAEGTIFGPLPVRGAFRNSGTHRPGTGGPEQVDEVRPSYPATYEGRVLADAIELVVDVDLPSGPTRLGPYRLQSGSEGNLFRCL
jgi:hypothetical protein